MKTVCSLSWEIEYETENKIIIDDYEWRESHSKTFHQATIHIYLEKLTDHSSERTDTIDFDYHIFVGAYTNQYEEKVIELLSNSFSHLPHHRNKDYWGVTFGSNDLLEALEFIDLFKEELEKNSFIFN